MKCWILKFFTCCIFKRKKNIIELKNISNNFDSYSYSDEKIDKVDLGISE